MDALVVIAFVVAWALWEGTSRNVEQRRRMGLLGTLGPAVPERVGDRDRRLRPIAATRVRRAIGSAALWSGAAVASLVAWGVTPGSFFICAGAALFVGDLVSVTLRRRFVARYEDELGSP